MTAEEKQKEFQALYPVGPAGLNIEEQLALTSLCCILYRLVKQKMPLKDPIETIQAMAKIEDHDMVKILEARLIVAGSFLQYEDKGEINAYGCSSPAEIIDAIKQLINKTLPF